MLFKKRGYFFTLDAMMALFILAIGVFYISATYVNVPQLLQVEFLADDLLNFFSNTIIQNLNNAYAGFGGGLWKNGYITTAENSLLQQIGEFYEKNKKNLAPAPPPGQTYLDIAEKFIEEVSKGIVPEQYKYEVWIIDSELPGGKLRLYPKTTTPEHENSKSNTKLLLTSREITFGIINKETGDLWGPYGIELHVWEK